MRRIKDGFLSNLITSVPLQGKLVLEIGCGDGTRSEAIARECQLLIGVDPDKKSLRVALDKKIPNAAFIEGTSVRIPVAFDLFDVVIFTLSFHHVPVDQMRQAIREAVRVVVSDGYIVFLEPDADGSFFDAEIRFDACDGDEREAKRQAFQAMMTDGSIDLVREFSDETVFGFDSLEDFVTSMKPKRDIDAIQAFLVERDFQLVAKRRIDVFKLRHG